MIRLLVVFAVLLRILSNPLANVFQKQLAVKGNSPLVINFLTYFLLSIACLFICWTIKWDELPASFWLYSVLGGIVGAVGNGFLVKALESGDLSVLGPINAYKSVIGIITGFFLLYEIPNVWGLLGVLLIIYGSYFVLDTTTERFTWALLKRKEIQFRIWAMILTGIEAVFSKKVILASSVTTAFISWCWWGSVFSFIFLLISGQNKNEYKIYPRLADFKKYLYLIICIGTMQITTIYVLNNMAVGYALSLFQLSTIISVLLGHRIFKEKDIRKKLIGTLIMLIGSVIIIRMKN